MTSWLIWFWSANSSTCAQDNKKIWQIVLFCYWLKAEYQIAHIPSYPTPSPQRPRRTSWQFFSSHQLFRVAFSNCSLSVDASGRPSGFLAQQLKTVDQSSSEGVIIPFQHGLPFCILEDTWAIISLSMHVITKSASNTRSSTPLRVFTCEALATGAIRTRRSARRSHVFMDYGWLLCI